MVHPGRACGVGVGNVIFDGPGQNEDFGLEDAIAHHLDVATSARNYDAVTAGVDADLTHHLGPIEPVLARLDPMVATPIRLPNAEFGNLVSFVRDGLLDANAAAAKLCPLAPTSVPSGAPVLTFEGCP